jgi:hypothetical protein
VVATVKVAGGHPLQVGRITMSSSWKKSLMMAAAVLMALPVAGLTSTAQARDPVRSVRRTVAAPTVQAQRTQSAVAARQQGANGNSPSDVPAQRLQPVPMNQSQSYAGNCGCTSGGYATNNANQMARVNNNGGYRSFSYQGAEPQLAPTTVYNGGFNNGYYGNNYSNGTSHIRGVPNEANPRNFSGHYGSRAALHFGH